MTVRKYSSRSQQTTLSSPITSTATTMSVVNGASVMGGKTLTGTQTYTVVIDPDTALEEIVDVTVYSSGNTLTITRGIDGPTPGTGVAHSAGAVVRHMAIGRDYQEANDHIEATTGHGATGAVVGTTNTQVLTNKDLSSATNTLSTSVVTLTGTQTLSGKTLTSPTITGTGAIAGTFTGNLTGNVTGNVSGTAGSATGNAGTATALATARTFQLTGDVEASGVTFDGTGNVSLTTVIGTGAIVNADVNASAAIDKTKISGTAITAGDTGTVTSTMIANDTIVNTDINTSAQIAYSKINATNSIVNADINASAAIALSKLATDPLARANHTGTQAASTITDLASTVKAYRLDEFATPNTSVALGLNKLTGVSDPTLAQDAATKAYVDTSISNLIAGAPSTLNTLDEIAAALADTANFSDTVVLKTGSTMSGALAMGTNKITGVGDPTNAQDVATKNYIDTTVLAPSNLTGPITSVGSATSIASQTGTGTKFVVDNTPTLITPVLGVATATSINGTTIPASKTLVATDSTTYVVPSQTGNTGKFLTTNGSASSWAAVDALPSQTGNAGKFLTTDATTASWSAISGSLAQPTEPSSPTDGLIWVDTDGTALINQLLRWSKATANGTTTLSGNDDNSIPLTYSVGYEQVFQNGVLLARGSDYTATSGTTISLTNASVTGDIFEVFAAQPVAISDVYTQTQANAAFINDSLLTTTGDTIYASGANTPARLGIGTTGQVLTVASGIPSWATPAAGGMTLLSTTTLSGSTTTISSINGTYNQLCIQVFDAYGSGAGGTTGRFNGDATTAAYQLYFAEPGAGTVYPTATPWYYSIGTAYNWTTGSLKAVDTNFFMQILLPNYADTTSRKLVNVFAAFENAGSNQTLNTNDGFWNNTAAITSITFTAPGGGTWTQGTVKIWGIK